MSDKAQAVGLHDLYRSLPTILFYSVLIYNRKNQKGRKCWEKKKIKKKEHYF